MRASTQLRARASEVEAVMLNAISRRGGQSKLWSNADFEIGANLGMGTFGVVKRARENTTGHIVALKKVSTCNVAPRNRKQILREIEIQSRLKHRHILQLYNYYMNEEFTEIILIVEYAAGGDLFSLIEEASKANTVVRPQLAAKYIYQIANALEFCHLNRNIIHRDLKPENVLLDINGDAKLADFGASVHSPNENPRCSMVGTLNFMAPELLSNDWYLFDVDHWALGVVAFMLTAGQMPFHGANFEELKESIFRNEVLYPIHMPAGAADLVSQLLRTEPSERIGLDEVQNHPWVVNTYKTYKSSDDFDTPELFSEGFPPLRTRTFDKGTAGTGVQSGSSSSYSSSRQLGQLRKWGNFGDLADISTQNECRETSSPRSSDLLDRNTTQRATFFWNDEFA